MVLFVFCNTGKLPPLFPVLSKELAVNGSVPSYSSKELVLVSVSSSKDSIPFPDDFLLSFGECALLNESSFDFSPCQDGIGVLRVRNEFSLCSRWFIFSGSSVSWCSNSSNSDPLSPPSSPLLNACLGGTF
jgi:hypothetical protein